jgi:RNA polymerase sigma factor (TIGR02999 family)
MTLLDATSLVHEFYLRLQSTGELEFPDRRHFFAYASKAMRSIVIDAVRDRLAQRRGGGAGEVALDTGIEEMIAAPGTDILGVHAALDELEQVDARLASVVEMRYFGGFSEAEIAEALEVTERTVQRDWHKARLLLAAMLRPEGRVS